MASILRPWLRIGPQDEAAVERDAGRFVVNVLEASPQTPHDLWIPILRAVGDEVEADTSALDAVTTAVRESRDAGRIVYLHCGQGMERSPLAAAWVLWKLGEWATFDAAYGEVARLHPQTQRRDSWVSWSARQQR